MSNYKGSNTNIVSSSYLFTQIQNLYTKIKGLIDKKLPSVFDGYIYKYTWGGSQDKNWKKVFTWGHTSTVPTANTYVGSTVYGKIYHMTGNYTQGETREYPFQVHCTFLSGKSVSDSCVLEIPNTLAADTIIRVVRISTNNFELQVRQPTDWNTMKIEFCYSGNCKTQTPCAPTDSTNSTVIKPSVITSINYPTATGVGASGTWGINISGNSSTATALSSSAGSTTQPMYFKDGKPTATAYALNKTVPSDAKFTDTNTWRGVQDNLTSTSKTESLSANQGKVLKGLIDNMVTNSYDKTIDLSGSTYSQDTWYPVTSIMDGNQLNSINVDVSLNSGTKPSWSTHDKGFTVHLHVLAMACGWGTSSNHSIVICNEYSWSNVHPVGYTQLNSSSEAILYLRGGGKYFVNTNYNADWVIHTSTYTSIDNSTVSPTNTYPNVVIDKLSINADIDTVNGSHAWEMQTLSATGSVHGSGSWVAKIQHHVDGDYRFKLLCGDGSIETKVDYSNSCGNADTVDGCHVSRSNDWGLRSTLLGTWDLVPGSSPMGNGDVYFQYE